MRNTNTLMRVHPDFKRKLKMESADNNMSIINYTKLLSEKEFVELPNIGKTKKDKRMRGVFDFGF